MCEQTFPALTYSPLLLLLNISYFNEHVEEDAIIYLILANEMLHELRHDIITIADDVSMIFHACCL